MATISYKKLWVSEFNKIVSKKDKVKDRDFSQVKLEVHDTYEKDGKVSTNLKNTGDSDVINKGYLDGKNILKRRSYFINRKKL